MRKGGVNKRKIVLRLDNAPHVNSIKDLIELGKSLKFYKNIDMVMMWRILPHLEELDKMIGMKKLKESVFYQIIYYLKGMHTSNNEEYLHTMIMGPPGHGKCLGKDTPVIMYDGSTKMVQNIKVEDLIMGDDSTPRKIMSTCTGKETMYKIHQSYGDDYIVNESHILSLKLLKNPKIRYLEKTIQVVWFSKDKKNKKVFTYSFLNKAKYFFNTLPKKGSIIDINVVDYLKKSNEWKTAYKGFKVNLKFTDKKELLKLVPEEPTRVDPYMLGLWLGSNTSTISDTYNIFENKHIPNIYKTSSTYVRIALLEGILDSKGCDKQCGKIIEKNKDLADDILFLIRSLGFRASKFRSKCTNKENYTIIFNIKEDELTYDIKVEKLDVDDYYGFEIDGNHRFLLGDFTVTHNTNTARIIGKLYQEMGILSMDGPFKIAYRDDFIAEYLGQTAVKTRKLLNSCIGGVLFVDEVYSLGSAINDKDSFSKEAIEVLTAFLSEHKKDFCFIGAGYEEDINKCFFSRNKGLERRFQWVHKIEEYSAEEIVDIMSKMIVEMNWKIELNKQELIEMIKKDKHLFKFAGGDLEILLSKSKMVHAKRVFSLDKDKMFILTKTDLENGIKLMKENKLKQEPEDTTPFYMYT
jgi:hypothetical protein